MYPVPGLEYTGRAEAMSLSCSINGRQQDVHFLHCYIIWDSAKGNIHMYIHPNPSCINVLIANVIHCST